MGLQEAYAMTWFQSMLDNMGPNWLAFIGVFLLICGAVCRDMLAFSFGVLCLVLAGLGAN